MTDTHELPKLPEPARIRGVGWEYVHDFTADQMHAYLLADRSARAPTLASGEMVMVPREPTEAMLKAAADWSRDKFGRPVGNDGATGCYRAMLAAVPTTSLLASEPASDERRKLAEEATRWAIRGMPGCKSRDFLIECIDRLAAMPPVPAVSEWISTEDRLPEEHVKAYQVISIAKKLHGPGNYEGQGIKAVAQDWNVRNYASNYTHWMYLPATPGESA